MVEIETRSGVLITVPESEMPVSVSGTMAESFDIVDVIECARAIKAYWEVSRLAFPGDPKQEGILIGAMAWIGLPTSIMEAILGARTYDDAKTIIWRL